MRSRSGEKQNDLSHSEVDVGVSTEGDKEEQKKEKKSKEEKQEKGKERKGTKIKKKVLPHPGARTGCSPALWPPSCRTPPASVRSALQTVVYGQD
jgi:hypothetical protein